MTWTEHIRENLTTAEDLRGPLRLTSGEYERIREELRIFPMSVTKYYFSLIDPEDPKDPIRRMAIPTGIFSLTDGMLDTSGEKSNTRMRGMQHKYRETVLVLTTNDCAMFCRHCFRRRLVGKASDEIAVDPGAIAAYIRLHPEVTNVLLTGGDFFLLPSDKIAEWLELLVNLEQLDFIRFGTRTPVTFPHRILEDPELTDILAGCSNRKQLYAITHFNHPREFTPEAEAAIRALQKAGVVLKNQTVLLRGVNDDPDTLSAVLRRVTSLGMIQHYIFQCRPVQGIKSRFQVPFAEGSLIVQEALNQQNGLGKSAEYTMSHVTGKLRILGLTPDGSTWFQYKEAKNPADLGRIFPMKLDPLETWLPDPLVIPQTGRY